MNKEKDEAIKEFYCENVRWKEVVQSLTYGRGCDD